jgi:hypothetical protein
MNRTVKFLELQVANKYMKKFSTSLALNELQIKMTLRFHPSPVIMANINSTNDKKYWWECWQKGTLIHYWWEDKLEQLLWKSLWRFLKTLRKDILYYPVIPVIGIFLKECKPGYDRTTYTSMFILRRPKITGFPSYVETILKRQMYI